MKIKTPIRSLLILWLLTFAAGITRAADRYDILVNDDNSSAEMSGPRVAAAANGSSFVAWVDKRGGVNDIYGQYFDSLGNPQGSNFKINRTDSGIIQQEISLGANIFGQLAGVWKDYRNSPYPFRSDIYFSGIDSAGSFSDYNLTAEWPDSACESPDLALLGNGSGIVVWSDYRNRNWDIYAQRIGVNGEPVGPNFKVNSDVGIFQQHAPRVEVFPGGGFVVVWYDNRSGSDDIFGQRFDAAFNPVGINFSISDDAGSSRQAFPAIAADSRGRFFVAWVDWRNGAYPQNPDIYLRRYDSSGAPLAPSMRINLNDGGKAQREISICSDWAGIIGAVWADSSSGQWDIAAQIIGDDGLLVGSSFRPHQNTSGRQLQPDIASNGYRHYFVWMDSRSGQFDIYLTIRQYNQPGLVASPASLDFTMTAGGPRPPSQNTILTNAGLGPLNWTISAAPDWVQISPSSGTTPDTVNIEITSDTLPYGVYSGIIRLVDSNHNDSSHIIPISLTVTAPFLEIDPDTVNYRVFAAMGNPAPQYVRISNTGTGLMTWSATTNAPWLLLDDSGGSAPDTVAVRIDISGLEFGSHSALMTFASPEAINTPETILVKLELVGNMPYLGASPDSLSLEGGVGEVLHDTIIIRNLGFGQLNWHVMSGYDWLQATPESGSDNDTIFIAAETSNLSESPIETELIIFDSAAFNQAIRIPVHIILHNSDTVIIGSHQVQPGGHGIVPVELRLSRPCRGAYIPFTFDTAMMHLDSVILNTAVLPNLIADSSRADIGAGVLAFFIPDSIPPESTVVAGIYNLGNLYFTAGEIQGAAVIDRPANDTIQPYILTDSIHRRTAAYLAGQLLISGQTAVENPPSDLVPREIALLPNYPNPFNSATILGIELPGKAFVSLVVFNVLGQEVRHLFAGTLLAGDHYFSWDGAFDSGRPAPSGVYFYRLAVDSKVRVRKMMLIK